MPLEWLEPSIENRIIELSDRICGDETDDLFGDFMAIVKSIQQTHPLSKELLFQIENIFILKIKSATDISYRTGISDGLKIRG